jgi:hypothetical protein
MRALHFVHLRVLPPFEPSEMGSSMLCTNVSTALAVVTKRNTLRRNIQRKEEFEFLVMYLQLISRVESIGLMTGR